MDSQAIVSKETVIATAGSIDEQIQQCMAGEKQLDRNYARLAALLARFKDMEGWRFLDFASMAKYLASLQEKYGRSSAQLWAYTAVATQLLPSVSEAGLDQMGVSKAFELTRASKRAKQPVTPELIEVALDSKTTAAQVRAAAYEAYNFKPEEHPKGSYYDFGGFYADDEERKEFKEFWEIGTRILGLVKETPQWLRTKLILQAAVREFNGAHAAEAYGYDQGGPALDGGKVD